MRDTPTGTFATAEPVLRAFADDVEARIDDLEEPPDTEQLVIDYVALFSRDKARARAARRRARYRRG